ncbi:hypothetical protein ACFQ15_08095 [Sphingomonas hankookensis]|uniref:hypothetical protein n=1 Tax=Sphingomonas hankookensis TaxID=563996 RepID=UPI001F574425|nr:hypothetical protein [Sphingomonas hankookensis]
MPRIAPRDPVLLLLRERLQRGASAVRADAAAVPGPLSPVQRTRAMAALAALDPDARRRMLVRAVLAERLGEAVANDAAFQQVSERVLALLDATEEGRVLVADALKDVWGG